MTSLSKAYPWKFKDFVLFGFSVIFFTVSVALALFLLTGVFKVNIPQKDNITFLAINVFLLIGFHLFETDFSSKTQILISVVARFIEAIFWGTIYYRTKNLSYTVILHSFANFSSGLVIMVLDSRFLEFIFKFV